jgi:membrane peptidoglycan carboxypeptidase
MRLLEGVVENGTGKEAAIAGYRVGGKTGTAEKSNRQGYSRTGRLASFVGFAPARQPRLVAVVMIDEPNGATGGGVVAAPVFREIVSEALLYLGIRPGLDDDLLLLAATERPPGPRFLRVPPSSPAPSDSPHVPLTIIADAAARAAPPRGALGGQP